MPVLNNAYNVMFGALQAHRVLLRGTTVWILPVPVNTVLPAITGTPTVGETLTCSTGTWTNSPTSYAYQWQELIGGVWTNLSGETANTYTTDHAGFFRCLVTASNAFGPSEAPAAAAQVEVTEPSSLPTDAISVTGGTEYFYRAVAEITGGARNFCIGALVYIESGSPADWGDLHPLITVQCASGRYATTGTDNVFGNWRINVAGQGTTVVVATQPVSGQWYYMTLGGDNVLGDDGGQFRVTFQPVEGGTLISQYVDKSEFFGTAAHTGTYFNTFGDPAGGDGWPQGLRFQSVRLYLAERDDTQIQADRTNQDPTGAHWWWDFTDAGGGTPGVADLTGNGRTPTIVGGEMVAGPGA